jgi:arginine/serine-rich splicing factor 16
MLRFEAYRDLVRLLVKGVPDAAGLNLVEQEVLARRAQQHAAQQAADEMALGQRPGGGGGGAGGGAAASSAPLPMAAYGAGTGAYSAVGFSYGADGAPGEGDDPFSSGGDSSSDEEEDAGSEEEGAPVTEAEAAQEAEDERVDDLAEAYGLRDFSYRLHKVQELEGEQALMRLKPPR